MKDKLVKTGHKKAYYRLRAFGLSLAALFGIGLSASLPIFVTYEVSVSQTLAKEAEQKQEESETTEETSVEIEEE